MKAPRVPRRRAAGPLRPRLVAITDTAAVEQQTLLERCERLCAAAAPGSVLVQLRDLELGTRCRFALGRTLAALTERHEQLLAVNDRLDLAVLLEADAVHLGERSVATDDARRIVGPLFVSRAAHSPEQVSELAADAVILSPVCAPRKGAPALGMAGLALAVRIAKEAPRAPLVYALGGVTANEAAACLGFGAAGVAAIGAAFAQPDPEPLLSALGIRR